MKLNRELKFKCANCKAEIFVENDKYFYLCTYCNTTNYFDSDKTISTYLAEPLIENRMLLKIINKFLHSKNLHNLDKIILEELTFLPLFIFNYNDKQYYLLGSRKFEELDIIFLPSSKIVKKTINSFDKQLSNLDFEIEKAKEILGINQIEVESILVYYPFWKVVYQYQSIEYNIIIDATSGKEYAINWPKIPWMKTYGRSGLVMILAFITFFIIAFISGSILINIALYLLMGLIFWYILNLLLINRNE